MNNCVDPLPFYGRHKINHSEGTFVQQATKYIYIDVLVCKGVFTNGGAAPNILPEESELMYYLQAPDEDKLSVVKRKVLACAEGAAQAAECKVCSKY